MDIENQSEKLKTNLVGFDDFLEDVFGLNIKGFKTLWASFRKPKEYYKAAWSPSWSGKFTPSFRLWFTLTALTFFFQIFWGGADSAMAKGILELLKSANVPLRDGVDMKDVTTYYIRWYLGLIPMCSIVILLVFASIYRAWNTKTPFVIRQRNVFATIIPSTAVTFFLVMFYRIIPLEYIIIFSLFTTSIVFFLDSSTAYRGAFPETSNPGKLWRSGVLALCLQMTSLLAVAIAGFIAIIIAVANFS